MCQPPVCVICGLFAFRAPVVCGLVLCDPPPRGSMAWIVWASACPLSIKPTYGGNYKHAKGKMRIPQNSWNYFYLAASYPHKQSRYFVDSGLNGLEVSAKRFVD